VRVPAVFGGNGQSFRAYMAYDTGSTALTIWNTELSLLGVNPNILNQTTLQTATGITTSYALWLELRVLNQNEDRSLVDWQVEETSVRPAFLGAHRLSSKTLNGRFFILENPTNLELLVASSKTQLKKMF